MISLMTIDLILATAKNKQKRKVVKTGKEAVCTPEDLGGRNPKKYYSRPRYGKASRIESRTNVKQAALKAAKAYNIGEMNEDYDDIHLNSHVLDTKGCYCCG